MICKNDYLETVLKKIEEDVEIKKLDKPTEKPTQKERRRGFLNVLKKLLGNKDDENE
ncbi:hypothetical protein KKB40_06440 [Patescibacteria group bacterium]|nr:hypothetical protein [Patescibacteria group bacterium]